MTSFGRESPDKPANALSATPKAFFIFVSRSIIQTMKIFVKAKPGAKKEKIEESGKNNFTISVKEPADKGRANKSVIKALAAHFGIAPSRIRILSGHASRHKILEVARK